MYKTTSTMEEEKNKGNPLSNSFVWAANEPQTESDESIN